jgi:hypothetical protein
MTWQRNLNGYPTFSATAISLELVPALSNVGRQPEIAMAAYKPEVVITQERHEISTRFQRILDFFTTTNTMELSPTLSDVDRHPTTNQK